jgi:hypothetical protein
MLNRLGPGALLMQVSMIAPCLELAGVSNVASSGRHSPVSRLRIVTENLARALHQLETAD